MLRLRKYLEISVNYISIPIHVDWSIVTNNVVSVIRTRWSTSIIVILIRWVKRQFISIGGIWLFLNISNWWSNILFVKLKLRSIHLKTNFNFTLFNKFLMRNEVCRTTPAYKILLILLIRLYFYFILGFWRILASISWSCGSLFIAKLVEI
jgi:hypothetical protein